MSRLIRVKEYKKTLEGARKTTLSTMLFYHIYSGKQRVFKMMGDEFFVDVELFENSKYKTREVTRLYAESLYFELLDKFETDGVMSENLARYSDKTYYSWHNFLTYRFMMGNKVMEFIKVAEIMMEDNFSKCTVKD